MPPPAGAAARRSWYFLLGIWVAGVVSIMLLVWMGNAALHQQRVRADTMEATSNLRSLSIALHEFKSSYGAFPNRSTAGEVKRNTGSALPLAGTTSNDFFRQLMAAEICQSESLFHAKIAGAVRPDGVAIDSKTALAKGEVGFSYIVGQTSASHPKRPLVVTPLIPGTNRFDPKPFNGMAIVLCVDLAGSRSGPVFPINKNGEVIDASGKHILDPANPIWGGEVPVIVWPK
jgi:hypothetical protein